MAAAAIRVHLAVVQPYRAIYPELLVFLLRGSGSRGREVVNSQTTINCEL